MISKKTKIRIFKSNVLSVLLYAAESWKVTKGICHMMEVFQNKCLRRILHIFWPNKITNAEIHERTGMMPISLEVKKRRRRWVGHVNRMPPTSIPRVAMRWNPPETEGGDDQKRRGEGLWSERWRLSDGVGARSQSWLRTEQDGVPRCRPYVSKIFWTNAIAVSVWKYLLVTRVVPGSIFVQHLLQFVFGSPSYFMRVSLPSSCISSAPEWSFLFISPSEHFAISLEDAKWFG